MAVDAMAVLMPEAAMNEDDLLGGREHNVRATGKAPSVQPETVSKTVRQGTNDQFGFGVPAPDSPHDFGAASR
jgi:hypothetical protein